MIRGYAAQPSLLPGNRLGLHVSTTSPQFRVRFYRQGANLEYIAQSEWLRGIQAAEPATAAERTRDWNWPEYWFPIPSEWPSGVYIALLIEDVKGRLLDPPESAPAIDGRHGRVLFVVKNSAWQAREHPVQSSAIHIPSLQLYRPLELLYERQSARS